MRIFCLLALFFIFGLNFVHGQRFGYVDLEFILGRMPEYQKALDEIARLSADWENQQLEMQKNIQAMYDNFQAEQVLLTDEMKADRLAGIQEKENELKEFSKKVFGFEGLYFLKRKELVKPIQDKVFDAVERVAKQNNLGTIFDKSGSLIMIYTDPRFDYTDFVLEELGLGDPNDVVK